MNNPPVPSIPVNLGEEAQMRPIIRNEPGPINDCVAHSAASALTGFLTTQETLQLTGEHQPGESLLAKFEQTAAPRPNAFPCRNLAQAKFKLKQLRLVFPAIEWRIVKQGWNIYVCEIRPKAQQKAKA